MQGTIAQLLSLTAHGNDFLAGRPLGDFYPSDSVFKFCKNVKFVNLEQNGTGWSERPFADDPLLWLDAIKSSGVIQLRACHFERKQEGISDRMSAGFVGGGGRWLLECVTAAGSDFWEARWEVGDKNDPDQNIWNVTYGRIAKGVRQAHQEFPSVQALRSEMSRVLEEIRIFANQNGLESFGECFSSALQALSSNPSESKGYRLSPPGALPIEVEQLINACQAAWVFGGMGSWNDQGFSDEATNRKYEDLSDQLFNLVNLSLVAAINPARSSTLTKVPNKKKWWNWWG